MLDVDIFDPRTTPLNMRVAKAAREESGLAEPGASGDRPAAEHQGGKQTPSVAQEGNAAASAAGEGTEKGRAATPAAPSGPLSAGTRVRRNNDGNAALLRNMVQHASSKLASPSH